MSFTPRQLTPKIAKAKKLHNFSMSAAFTPRHLTFCAAVGTGGECGWETDERDRGISSLLKSKSIPRSTHKLILNLSAPLHLMKHQEPLHNLSRQKTSFCPLSSKVTSAPLKRVVPEIGSAAEEGGGGDMEEDEEDEEEEEAEEEEEDEEDAEGVREECEEAAKTEAEIVEVLTPPQKRPFALTDACVRMRH